MNTYTLYNKAKIFSSIFSRFGQKNGLKNKLFRRAGGFGKDKPQKTVKPPRRKGAERSPVAAAESVRLVFPITLSGFRAMNRPRGAETVLRRESTGAPAFSLFPYGYSFGEARRNLLRGDLNTSTTPATAPTAACRIWKGSFKIAYSGVL